MLYEKKSIYRYSSEKKLRSKGHPNNPHRCIPQISSTQHATSRTFRLKNFQFPELTISRISHFPNSRFPDPKVPRTRSSPTGFPEKPSAASQTFPAAKFEHRRHSRSTTLHHFAHSGQGPAHYAAISSQAKL